MCWTFLDDLKEYLSIEEGQDTSLSYDDINCTDEDIYGGEVQVEGKEVVVHNLRIKPEVVDLLGLKKDWPPSHRGTLLPLNTYPLFTNNNNFAFIWVCKNCYDIVIWRELR